MPLVKRLSCAFLLLGLGWAIGHAQRAEPEFMISIDAPAGETRIECVSGCQLTGARDLGNPNAGRANTYRYSCSGQSQRCYAKAGGWLIR
jgi:hypothetical protein